MAPQLLFSPNVLSARRSGQPIVALETSILSHGLPWPTNLETALDIEQAVRQSDASPATIAVLGGKIRVGLTNEELEFLARSSHVIKASQRDLPWLVATNRTAATTVSGTIFIAYRAGIKLMATGGIGGVHRNVTKSSDVSTDLIELARTPVSVVCSGAKVVLDLARTLEYLETLGVPVVGYGTDKLPAFLASSSSLALDIHVDGPKEAASLIQASDKMGLHCGIVFANPVPHKEAIPRDKLEEMVAKAIETAEQKNVSGKALTPFLLDQIQRLGGQSVVSANRALVVQNARVAAQIAAALSIGEHS